MNIGFIDQQTFKPKKDEPAVKWLEVHFRMAGVRPFSAKLSKNKQKEENENAPDFHIYLRANVNRGDKFRDLRIGALWIKTKVIDDVEKTFMTGYVESPLFGKQAIAVWKAEPYYDGEVVHYLYDVKTMEDQEQNNDSYEYSQPAAYPTAQNQAAAPEQKIPEIDIDEDEIPF